MKPRKSTLLIGTSDGLVVLSSPPVPSGLWQAAPRQLEGEWVTSITPATCHDPTAYLLTTRSGKVAALKRGKIVVCHDLAMRLWFATELSDGRVCVGTSGKGLMVFDTKSGSWQSLGALNLLLQNLGWHSHSGGGVHLNTLLVNPVRSIVYVAGEVGGVMRGSADLTTWEDVTFDLDPDVHTIASDTRAVDTLYAATGSGLFRRTSDTSHWDRLGPDSFPYVQGVV
ncbi:MAG: hypothetical protein ACRD3S_01995, partial [Terracidiphilus sp.]